MSKKDYNTKTMWAIIKGLIEEMPTPLPEYKFDENRRWRFDYAFPELKLAIEINGGVHRIKNKYLRDLEKLNAAAIQGWMVIQIDNNQVKNLSCLNTVLKAIKTAQKNQSSPSS